MDRGDLTRDTEFRSSCNPEPERNRAVKDDPSMMVEDSGRIAKWRLVDCGDFVSREEFAISSSEQGPVILRMILVQLQRNSILFSELPFRISCKERLDPVIFKILIVFSPS